MCPEIDQKYPYFMQLLLERQKELLADVASRRQPAVVAVTLDHSKVGRLFSTSGLARMKEKVSPHQPGKTNQ